MNKLTITVLAVYVCLTGIANAGLITLTATENAFCTSQVQFCDQADIPGQPTSGSFDLSVAAPIPATGDATFTLSAFGDFFGGSTETFGVSIEGYDVGIFLNNDSTDDLFDNDELDAFGIADRGGDYGKVDTASLTIALADLAQILADGIFTVTFDSDSPIGNNDIQGDGREFISYQLSYETSAVAVPEPATSIIFFLAIACLFIVNRRNSFTS